MEFLRSTDSQEEHLPSTGLFPAHLVITRWGLFMLLVSYRQELAATPVDFQLHHYRSSAALSGLGKQAYPGKYIIAMICSSDIKQVY